MGFCYETRLGASKRISSSFRPALDCGEEQTDRTLFVKRIASGRLSSNIFWRILYISQEWSRGVRVFFRLFNHQQGSQRFLPL
jgi:hypothetical protein